MAVLLHNIIWVSAWYATDRRCANIVNRKTDEL